MGEFSNVIEKAKVSVTTGVVRATVAILVFEKKKFIDYLTSDFHSLRTHPLAHMPICAPRQTRFQPLHFPTGRLSRQFLINTCFPSL